MKLLERLQKQSQWLIFTEALLLVGIVGFVDYVTGYDVSVFVLYSIPILFVVWFSGQRAGIVICLACAIAWGISDASGGHPYKQIAIFYWNTALQLGFFCFAMLCSSALKFQLQRTRAQIEALERFHILAEISPVGIFRAGADGECLYVNQRWCNIAGLSPREALSQKWTGALHPDDSERVAAQWANATREKRTLQFQARFQRPNGKSVWTLGHVAAERDSAGEICGYVGAIADMTEHRRLERQILEISEREQQRIGQDLHDDLCQFLAAIQYAASSLRGDLHRKAVPEAEAARELADLLKEAIVRTRNLARGIFPVQLEQVGLISALHELAAATSRLFGISCSFEYEPPLLISDSTAATHVYRIAQEALTNAIRHGKAQNIVIALAATEEIITLSVKDNGTGFLLEEARREGGSSGMGLRIMEYRSHMIGGTLKIDAVKGGGGTLVTCSFRKRKCPLPSLDAGLEASPIV